MSTNNNFSDDNRNIEDFLKGKTEHSVQLFHHFVSEYRKTGEVTLYTTKTMIAVSTARKSIAWITQIGKNFVHVVFPFETPYHDNLCFQKIAQVPGDKHQFNHHLRLYSKEDVNAEVKKFMALAYEKGKARKIK